MQTGDFQFFSADDLAGVFEELEEANKNVDTQEDDTEMQASQERYESIIKKHRVDE